MKSRLLPQLLLAFALARTVWADPTPAIFPFEPKQLLSVLPAAPAEWTITRSDAETTLSDWPQTTATRVFRAPVTTASAPEANTSGEAEIAIVDTAGYAPALAGFANFSPAKADGFEKKLIGALPAIITGRAGERQVTQVLVSSRYLVEITLTNFPPSHRAEDWLRLFRFASLPPTSPSPTTQAREFRLTYVDELKPANNRSYVVTTSSSKRLDEFLKSLPPEPKEAAPSEPSAQANPGNILEDGTTAK